MSLIHVASAEYTRQLHADDCPADQEPEMGFGLAGGGYGSYSYCPRCGAILDKTEEHFD